MLGHQIMPPNQASLLSSPSYSPFGTFNSQYLFTVEAAIDQAGLSVYNIVEVFLFPYEGWFFYTYIFACHMVT
jgi:hypothetical protein